MLAKETAFPPLTQCGKASMTWAGLLRAVWGLPCILYFQENNMIVYVEKKVLEDPAIVSDESFGPVKKKFCTFREGMLS